jgi:hypothetical protein
MPALAYLACCGSNLNGEASPPLPADPATPLTPGLYSADRDQAIAGAVDPTSITFVAAPFVACGTPDVVCEEGVVDGDVGISPNGRSITLPLDVSLEVVVGGFECDADGFYTTDHQVATGVEFAAMQTELDQAYLRTVAPLVVAQTAFEDFATLFATPTDGFSVPCSYAGQLVFQGAAGPAILLQTLGRYDDDLGQTVAATSISVEVIHLTAYEVATDGSQRLYFYAGFLS